MQILPFLPETNEGAEHFLFNPDGGAPAAPVDELDQGGGAPAWFHPAFSPWLPLSEGRAAAMAIFPSPGDNTWPAGRLQCGIASLHALFCMQSVLLYGFWRPIYLAATAKAQPIAACPQYYQYLRPEPVGPSLVSGRFS